MAKRSKSGGRGRQTSDRVSSIASKALRGEKLTQKEIKSLAGSNLSQDQTKGKRGGR